MKPLDLVDDIVVFDIDGVLGKYDFGPLGFKIVDEHKWIIENMKCNMYNTVEKTSLFDELIEEKNAMDMYILSVALSSYEQENKKEFILRCYPNIREEHIIFVAKPEYKVDVMKRLRCIYDNGKKSKKRIVLIEDNVGTMADIERVGNDKLRCFLVSDFI